MTKPKAAVAKKPAPKKVVKKTAVKKSAPAKKSAPSKKAIADKTKAATGHNLNGKAVKESRDDLAGLMKAFDNHGVSIVEEQWRKFSDEEKRLGTKWANDMRIGAQRPVPEFLRKYATKETLAKSDEYLADQAEQRKVRMACRFGKPSPTKPGDGDDGEPKIKMTALIPLDDIGPGTAEELFGAMRCKVEFTLRGQDIFDGKELPGTESVLSCVSDIKGYGRKMREWQVSFMVSQTILSIEDAFDRFWNNRGSLRVTTMEPLKHEEQVEAVKSNVPEKPADPKQPSLFNPEGDERKPKKGGVIYRQKFDAKTKEFSDPEEFNVPMPISGDKHACIVSVGEGPNGQFYATSRIDFIDEDGD